ncbi:peptidase yqhT [Fusarium napiforme]|uniref:Peptidase yqhT n=1 Tax=Fusarium napiforme TaxID=42672 RepID=A0A8H5K3U8_9HYPO|nr:peptidase yqhT [Fusarium napiforme]
MASKLPSSVIETEPSHPVSFPYGHSIHHVRVYGLPPHLAQGHETVDEVRTAKSVTFTSSGPKIHYRERKWAQEMVDMIESLVGKRSATVGLERINANVAIVLKELVLSIVVAQRAIEMARTIKSPEEVKCIVASLRATEVAVGKLRDSIAPGLTENQL